MRRLAVCVVAGALLFGLTASAQAVPPRLAPAIYLLYVPDANGNVHDVGAMRLYADYSCDLAWASEGWSLRNGAWDVYDFGKPGSLVEVDDSTVPPAIDFNVSYYAPLDFLLGRAMDWRSGTQHMVVGMGL